MSYSETAALNAIFGILGTFWLLVVAYFVISIIANWKIFTKPVQPLWAAIVPFYNQDRHSVVSGTSVNLVGRRLIQQQTAEFCIAQ